MMSTVSHDEAVRQVREYIASGQASAESYRRRCRQYEQVLWEMRVEASYDVGRYLQYEAVVNAIREALGEEPFPAPTLTDPDAIMVQALEHGYQPPAPELICRRCGQSGRAGAYPFSTNPASGLCDDCH